jgi:alpha-glucosidase
MLAIWWLLPVALALPSQFPLLSPTTNRTTCTTYRVTSSAHSSRNALQLRLRSEDPCSHYGRPIRDLVLETSYESPARLAVHLYDAQRTQIQIPPHVLVRPLNEALEEPQSALRFDYQNNPFAFWITQKATGQVIFDTRGHTIIFEDECKLVRLPALPG